MPGKDSAWKEPNDDYLVERKILGDEHPDIIREALEALADERITRLSEEFVSNDESEED